MRRPSTIIALLVMLGLFGFAAIKILRGDKPQQQSRPRPTPVIRAEPPRIETVTHALSFTGDILPVRQVGIFSKVGGSLEEVLVEVGDWVKAGRLLARIDTTELSQQVLQTAATYHQAKTAFDRAQELAAKNLISNLERDNAETARQVAEAGYESAKLKLGYASIIAPFGGVITKRSLDVGALVNPNNAVLFTLVDFDTVRVIVDVLERDVPRVSRGMVAVITVDAYPSESFAGRVRRFSESVDLGTRTMRVEVDVPNPTHRLKPGMFATVTIVQGERTDALTIAAKSLFKDDKGYFVWLVKESQTVKQAVEVGALADDRVEVMSGLAAADSVVAEGMQLVRQGGKVIVK